MIRTFIVWVLFLSCAVFACGNDGKGNRAPTPTPTAALTQSYSLVGTINGQTAQGRLVLVHARGDLNLVKFDVPSFQIDDTQGSGSAQFFTLDNTLTITLIAHTSGLGDFPLTGHKAVVFEEISRSISDFPLTGGGYTITFSATAE